jgi:hypothetical protein
MPIVVAREFYDDGVAMQVCGMADIDIGGVVWQLWLDVGATCE